MLTKQNAGGGRGKDANGSFQEGVLEVLWGATRTPHSESTSNLMELHPLFP